MLTDGQKEILKWIGWKLLTFDEWSSGGNDLTTWDLMSVDDHIWLGSNDIPILEPNIRDYNFLYSVLRSKCREVIITYYGPGWHVNLVTNDFNISVAYDVELSDAILTALENLAKLKKPI